jgi:hypothetical protein
MRRFLACLRTDLTVIRRNNFPWIMLIALGVTCAAVYLLPRELKRAAPRYLYDATPERTLQKLLAREIPPERFLGSRESLEEAVRSGRENVGIAAESGPQGPTLTVLYNGTMPERQLRLVEAGLRHLWGQSEGEDAGTDVRVRLLMQPHDPIPLNLSLLPVLLAFEVIVLGFLFVAVMVFQEKQDGSIRAFRVSPAGTWSYLLSKVTLWVLLTVLYGTLLLLVTRGPGLARWLSLLALVGLSGLFMTLVGLAVSVFFRSISEWFFVGVGILVLNMLPQVSYLHPSFSPAWLTWLPSYPLLFALRDLLFRPGSPGQLRAALLQTGVGVALALPAAYFAVRGRLMRGPA